MVEIYTFYRPKPLKNHTIWGLAYTYIAQIREYPLASSQVYLKGIGKLLMEHGENALGVGPAMD